MKGSVHAGMEKKVLLNPGPATTTDTVKEAQVVPDICPREEEFCLVMEEVEQALLDIVHADAREYAAVQFCGSGTLCMDACLNSLLPADKKILIINNGAYSSRAADICRAYGLAYVDLQLPTDKSVDIAAVKAALAEEDIAVVYATHQETGTGVLNPIRELGALAHLHKAVFVVDTTSTLAMLPLDVELDNIDFCMASAQKGIQAMAGMSFVIGKRCLLEESKNYPVRSYYSNLYMQYRGFCKNGQMRFTPPVQAIYAARQALREYFMEGEKNKYGRHRRIIDAIHKGAESLGLREVIEREYQSGLVVTLLYPEDENWDFIKVHDYCYQQGYTIYPGKMQALGTFRLCAFGAIDEQDIKAFWQVFREALAVYGVAVPVRYRKKS